MADTYGYNPDGTKQYDPSSYDTWGVYMGNRAPMVGQSNVATPGFNAWGSNESFDQWLPQYAKIQLARGRGSLPGVTAAQGTPEYRDQVAKQQEAAQWIIDRGGTVGDMGIRPAKGAGLNIWNQYSGYKGGEYSDAFRAMARRYYDNRAAMAAQANGGVAPTGGGTNPGGFGGGSPAGGGGTFLPGQTTPTGTTPSVNTNGVVPANPSFSTPSFAGPAPGANPGGVSSQDSYAIFPRGAKRGLRGLIG